MVAARIEKNKDFGKAFGEDDVLKIHLFCFSLYNPSSLPGSQNTSEKLRI